MIGISGNSLVRIGFLLCLGLFSSICAGNPRLCSESGVSQLNELVKETGASRLVFFASWCPGCREHILAKTTEKTILVAAFDQIDRAEEALRHLGITDAPCLFDDGAITQLLGVNSVPATRQYSLPYISRSN